MAQVIEQVGPTHEPRLLPRTALFISHANPEDNHFVRWLGAKLNAIGYDVWADVMRLHGGIDWARALENALRQRTIKMLVVCTKLGLEKQGIRNEIEIGVSLARQLNDDAFVIPLRLEPYESPFRIAQAQYINFEDGWARGFAELTELLKDRCIPRAGPGPLDVWLETHSDGADALVHVPEPLVSNWLELRSHPERIRYCEPPVGSPLERFQQRQSHDWPVVPHRGGVLTFATPNAAGSLRQDLPANDSASVSTLHFVEHGWAALGIDEHQARRMYADLGAQAFDAFCANRGLKSYSGSNGRISWWADVKTAPPGQVKFDWNYRRGSRQVIGQSGKRGVHWHYAINAQVRMAPVPHLRLATRLVFSENGLDPITEVRRAHSLRRSFAKGWRNARWRDMLCAYLWWLADGKSELLLPVAEHEGIALSVPPMQFSCPVSVAEGGDVPVDDDDPDVLVDEWTDEFEPEEQE